MATRTWLPTVEEADGPLYAAIVEALARDIDSGLLLPGDRLPTHRELAGSMKASIGTVTRAYIEAERRGLIHGRVGRGTFVRDLRNWGSYSPMGDRTRIDLGPMAVPAVPGDPGHTALSAALARLSARADLVALSGYQHHGGTLAQRQAGIRWLALCGVPAVVDEVTVCAGVQHGTSLLLPLLAGPEGVLMESLSYSGALQAGNHLRIPLHPVEIDAEGVVPESLDEAAARTGATVLYCTPTAHNPTCTTMPLHRREAVVRICRARGITIVENGALNPLVSDAPPPLAALAPERTCFVTSLSKATIPALRTGFVRTPPSLTDRVAAAVGASLWSMSPLLAEIGMQWVEDGTAEALRDARRGEAVARQAIAATALRGHRFQAIPESYFLWLEVPESRAALELVDEAAARDVAVGPAHVFAVRPGRAPNAVRLCLTTPATRGEVERGLTIVAGVLAGEGPPHRQGF